MNSHKDSPISVEIVARCGIDVLSAVNDGDSLLRQQLALLITSVDSCC